MKRIFLTAVFLIMLGASVCAGVWGVECRTDWDCVFDCTGMGGSMAYCKGICTLCQ